MKKSNIRNIKKESVGIRDLKKGLTKGQKQLIEDEKKYYHMIVALKKAREVRGMTQEELARKANLPRTTVTKIESGNRNATLQTLMALAGAMDKKLEIHLV